MQTSTGTRHLDRCGLGYDDLDVAPPVYSSIVEDHTFIELGIELTIAMLDECIDLTMHASARNAMTGTFHSGS